MRTYSRKKQEYQVIDNVKELCRLCLEKHEETIPIFKDDELIAALALRIMVCVGVEIHKEESLPNIICTNCHQELEKYYLFRKKCEMSYQKLKYHIYALRELENKLMANENDNVYLKNENQDVEIHFVEKYEKEMVNDMENIEIQLIEQDNDENPDLETFLKSILEELGVISSSDDGVVLQDGVRSFELETGDDDLISLELVEEDDEEPPNTEPSITNEPSDDKQLILDVPSNKQQDDNSKKKSGAWCAQCGRVFASRSARARHAAVHSGAKPYACLLCGRSFAQKAVLDRHKHVHQATRPYQCLQCDKSFTQRGGLATHAQTHSPAGRKMTLHACHYCDKVFLYASGLTRHMSCHAGVSHGCAHCGRHFNDPSSLARHVRTKHKASGNTTTTERVYSHQLSDNLFMYQVHQVQGLSASSSTMDHVHRVLSRMNSQ